MLFTPVLKMRADRIDRASSEKIRDLEFLILFGKSAKAKAQAEIRAKASRNSE